MKIIHIVGARPQFVKYFPIWKSIEKIKAKNKPVENILLHTGQHYDYEMSQIFFEQLDLPKPEINLGVGSQSHGKQTAQMLAARKGILSQKDNSFEVQRGYLQYIKQ